MTAWGTALVTGASSGIGEAIARELAAAGSRLVLVARSTDRLETLAAELRDRHGVETEVLSADLADSAQRSAVEARLSSGPAPVDLLVNNAGYATSGAFARLPVDGEVNEITLNVIAVVRLARAALPAMLERGRGGILNVSSVAGATPAPNTATYAATKAFVTSFSQSLHEEVRDTGVHVTALCPGFTRTHFGARAGMSDSHIPGFLWSDAATVAAAGLRAVERNQAVCTPGAVNRVATGALRVLPASLVRRVAGMMTGSLARQDASRKA